MDINVRKIEEKEKFSAQGGPVSGWTDARPKIQEVAVRVGLPKALSYWSAVSRWALIAFAALAPIFFLPFTGLPVAANKEILVFGLILTAFFALLGRILIEGRFRYPGHIFTAALSALVLVWGASAFFSFSRITSLIGGWAAPDSFFSILLFAVLAFSIAATFDRRDIKISLFVFLASLSILGLLELLQLLKIFILPFDFAKNSGFNPVGAINAVGALLAFGLIIVSGLMSSAEDGEISPLAKKLLGLAAIVFILNLCIIDFWAIWVGLALAMAAMISFLSAGFPKFDRSPTSKIPEVGLQEMPNFGKRPTSEITERQGLQIAYFQKAWLPSIVLLISLFFIFIPSPFSKFIRTPVEVSPSFGATWDIALNNFKAGHYLLGSGPNTFSYIFNLYKPVGINQTVFWSTVFTNGSSAMFSWLGAVGIFGILALLFLIAAFVRTGFKGFRHLLTGVGNPKSVDAVSQSMFVGVCFLFIMWFLYAANFTVMAFTFWGIGIFLAASTSSRQAASSFKEIRLFTSPPRIFLFSLLIVVLMVGAAAGFYFETNRYIAEVYFSKADYVSAVKFWQYDERYFQNLSKTIFSQLNDLLSRKDLPQETMRAQFQNITANAIAAAKQAQILNPQNPANGVLLGSIYENLIPYIADAANFALSAYGGAVSLDPQNPSNYLALARVEITLADLAANQKAAPETVNGYLDKAVSNLEQSLKLKNDYAPARFLLVQVYDRQGKLADAVKRAEELVVANNADVGALFQLGFLYYKSDRFDESKLVLERAVELSPNYSNARYFLGLIYDRESQQFKPSSAEAMEGRNKAIEQFLKISELNPDNNEVKKIIANLKAGKPALFGVAPPAPQNRSEAPVSEESKSPVQKLKK
ncbi:tetratricopeptide repeat protein [Candidatus Azambacteria bacterium]|nr:tetratricopeptide repeat protein [Candidatus Azambacteria bacterium]